MPLSKTDLFLLRAYSLIGTPYVYGGQRILGPNPVIDCSGLVVEIGDEMGRFPDDFDTTAQGLFDLLSKEDRVTTFSGVDGWDKYKSSTPAGALLFWGKDKLHIQHVSIYCGWGIMVDAAGGGSSVTSVDIANKVGAQVKQRLVTDKKDMLITAIVAYWI